MPEGHTIHRLARALDDAFTGTRPIVASPQGRFLDGAAILSGRTVESTDAWGKHLFVDFEGERVLNVHLGLIGSFSVDPYSGHPPEPVGAVRLRIVNPTHVADLRGATICELITPEQAGAILARLGPDPLRADADPDRAWARISRSSRPIGELLMDQSMLAGVGNVYRCEVLFRHRVDPFRPGREIRATTWRAIWDDLVDLLRIGVETGQIVTMADQVDAVGAGEYDLSAVPREPTGVSAWRPRPLTGALERRYYVYKRQGEPCRTCGSKVRVRLAAGRHLYWCGRCQRRR